MNKKDKKLIEDKIKAYTGLIQRASRQIVQARTVIARSQGALEALNSLKENEKKQ